MQVGPLEILIVAGIALIVFGPQKLPEIARTIARFIGELRRVASEVRTEFQSGLDDPVADEQNVPVPPRDGDEPGEPTEGDNPVRTAAED